MTVYKTPTAERAFINIYKKNVRKFGMKTALETLRQLHDVETRLEDDPRLGKLDPEYHSTHFRYVMKHMIRMFLLLWQTMMGATLRHCLKR